MPLIENMECIVCGEPEGAVGECADMNHRGESIWVKDDVHGDISGEITGINDEGCILASFSGNPPVVVFPDMVLR